MKRLIITTFLMLLTLPCLANTYENVTTPIKGEVTLDWISKSQIQRDENITQIKNILFTDTTVLKYPKKEFKTKYENFLKDKDHLQNYQEIAKGKKEDAKKNYAGFFLNNGLLVAYGIQYKNNMKEIFYYDAMGNLRYIDCFSSNYPKYPNYSSQYNVNGALIGTIYFNSNYDQYIYNHDKTFNGRWYKDKMYNKNAKVIMTRSNY